MAPGVPVGFPLPSFGGSPPSSATDGQWSLEVLVLLGILLALGRFEGSPLVLRLEEQC
jgi:hypothetical protein